MELKTNIRYDDPINLLADNADKQNLIMIHQKVYNNNDNGVVYFYKYKNELMLAQVMADICNVDWFEECNDYDDLTNIIFEWGYISIRNMPDKFDKNEFIKQITKLKSEQHCESYQVAEQKDCESCINKMKCKKAKFYNEDNTNESESKSNNTDNSSDNCYECGELLDDDRLVCIECYDKLCNMCALKFNLRCFCNKGYEYCGACDDNIRFTCSDCEHVYCYECFITDNMYKICDGIINNCSKCISIYQQIYKKSTDGIKRSKESKFNDYFGLKNQKYVTAKKVKYICSTVPEHFDKTSPSDMFDKNKNQVVK